MARLVFIVSRRRPELLKYLQQEFAGNADIEVKLDRRTGSRRREARPTGGTERRRRTRRQAPNDDRLEALGWAMVWRDSRPEG